MYSSKCYNENIKSEVAIVEENARLIFEQTRSSIQSIIRTNRKNEVTRDTNICKGGIYILFVDCFEDDTIIPFYIGQTGNFQKRHKQHFSEIMALNRLNRECYEYALFDDLYNGRSRACKIFSYMVNHGCSLKDLHMVVLEEIEDEKARLKTEQQYIDELNAPFFGFNQLNSVLRYIEANHGSSDKKDYELTKARDIELLFRFPLFGYGEYNWFRSCESFYDIITIKHPSRQIPNTFLKIFDSATRLKEIKLKLAEINHYIYSQAKDEVWNICQKTINIYFAERKLKSEDKKKLVIKVLLFDFEDERIQLEKYFMKYSNRIDTNIFEIIDRIHGKEIQYIKQQVINNQCEYRALNEEKEMLNNIIFGMLLPKHYVSHPLGAMEKNVNFNISNNEENVCYLNIEFTCFKSDYNYDYYPEATKIDYCVVNNKETKTKTVYIENSLTNFFERNDAYYCESGFKYGPFSPYLKGSIGTHIPISMEYKNGINEWSLQNKETKNFSDVFKEINRLINENTKMIYSTSGYKNTILRFAELEELSNTMLIKKLKRLCK